MTPKEISKEIFECGLAPHSDITQEWIEKEIKDCIAENLDAFKKSVKLAIEHWSYFQG